MPVREKVPGTTGVYRRPGGRFYFNYRASGGVMLWRRAGADLAEAVALRAELVKLRSEGVRLSASNARVREVATSWLASFEQQVVQRERSAQTLSRYREIVKNQILPALGKRYVRDVDRVAARELAETLRAQGLSESTVALALRTLRQVVRHAISQGHLGYDPLKTPGRVAAFQIEQRQASLGCGDIIRLLEHSSERWRLLFACIVFTGLRSSEMLALRWGDLSAAALTVRATLDRQRQVVVYAVDDPRRRVVAIPPRLRNALETHRQASPFRDDHDLIFPTTDGRGRTQRSLNKAFRTAVRCADLDSDLTPERLRHGDEMLVSDILLKALDHADAGDVSKTVPAHHARPSTQNL
jgi:integrase